MGAGESLDVSHDRSALPSMKDSARSSAMSRVAIPGMEAGESLNVFHDRCVMPLKQEADSKRRTIDEFVRVLHEGFAHSGSSVSEVHKGGSLGKGTAVRGSSDIDLVVFFNGVEQMNKLKKSRSVLLAALEGKVAQYKVWEKRVVLIKKTPFSLCYSLDGEEMDILPAFDVLSSKTAFVKSQTDRVKRVIRLVKYWKTVNSVDIRSYTLELITIYAARKTGDVSTDPLFKKVMELLQNCSSLEIAFDDNYKSQTYIKSFLPPYVLDPANPYMNTLHGKNTNRISSKAKETFSLL